jgi:hypothetical protein
MGRVQGSNPAKFPPIARECARSVGEFMVSLPFARLRNELRKSFILQGCSTLFVVVHIA